MFFNNHTPSLLWPTSRSYNFHFILRAPLHFYTSFHTFHVAATTIWNSLQNSIHSCDTSDLFRQHLRMCLLPAAFNTPGGKLQWLRALYERVLLTYLILSPCINISVETRTHRERDKMPRTPDFGCCCCWWCKVACSFNEAWRCLSETVAQQISS